MTSMIELLYSAGCPHFEPTLTLLQEILNEQNCSATISKIEVVSHTDAVLHRFLGSPSIRINDRDIEGAEPPAAAYSLRCRRYKAGDRIVGVPPRALIEAALQRHLADGRGE